MKLTNKITVRGKINKIITRPSHSYVTIVTYGDGKYEEPGFVFYDKEMVSGFKKGDPVSVEAYIQNRLSTVDGKRKYVEDYVGNSIRRTERWLKHLFPECAEIEEDGVPLRDENCAIMIGKCSHIYVPQPEFAVLTLVVPRAGHNNFCNVACFKRQAVAAEQMKEGDFIATIGAIQTNLREENERKVVKQGIICRDISLVDVANIEF